MRQKFSKLTRHLKASLKQELLKYGKKIKTSEKKRMGHAA